MWAASRVNTRYSFVAVCHALSGLGIPTHGTQGVALGWYVRPLWGSGCAAGFDHYPGHCVRSEVAGPHSGPYGFAASVGSAVRTARRVPGNASTRGMKGITANWIEFAWIEFAFICVHLRLILFLNRVNPEELIGS
jgi:hypothetical protein